MGNDGVLHRKVVLGQTRELFASQGQTALGCRRRSNARGKSRKVGADLPGADLDGVSQSGDEIGRVGVRDLQHLERSQPFLRHGRPVGPLGAQKQMMPHLFACMRASTLNAFRLTYGEGSQVGDISRGHQHIARHVTDHVFQMLDRLFPACFLIRQSGYKLEDREYRRCGPACTKACARDAK